RRRIQVVDVRRTVDLSRLAKYGIACVVMLGVFVLAGALFPQFVWRQGERVLVPWRPQPDDAGPGAYRPDDLLDPNNLKAPIKFDIVPGNVEVLEGAAVEVIAGLSRDTLGLDPTLFIRSGKPVPGGAEGGDWERIPMKSIERIFTYTAAIEDINRPLEYYVAVGNDESDHYNITVRKRLKVLGLETTTEFPAYLRRPPVTLPAYTGDIATLEGSKVTVNVKTNQPVSEGRVTLGSGREIPLVLTEAGGKATLDVNADDTWRYVVKNRVGEEVASERIFFIQALPDRPPTMDVMEPNNDQTLHPLSEVTGVLQVSEDWALDAVRMKLEVIRQGEDKVPERKSETRDFLPETWTGRVDQGTATMVLPLDAFVPKLKPGDSIFYHFEVTDRKGQSAASDLFFISVAEPEVFVYYGSLDWHAPDEKIPISPLMQFIAAAWQLELQRKELAPDELLAKCRQLAEKMLDPESGRLIDFIRLGARGDGKGPVLPDSDPRKKVAADHTKAGYDLLKSGEPGKAVVEFKIVWAILKQFFGDASIMLASADMRNPNAVMLEEGETFARIEQFSKMDMRELDRELQQLADQQVEWRRKLGRKELEKVEETRKEIAELKKDVEQLADDAREGKTEPKETTEPGEKKPGEEEKPGERKPGEQKPGEEKPGEEKPGEEKPGEEKPGERKPGEAGEDRRDEQRRGESLADRARRNAQRAEELARNLQDVIEGKEDEEVRKGLGNLRDAAAELERAARDIEGERLDIAETRAKTAHRFLDRAEQDLSDVKFGRLNEMVAAALAQGHRLSERQKKIADATGELEKKSDEIAKDRKRGDPRAGVEEQALREKTKTLSEAQAALSEQAEVFKKFVERMHEVSQKSKEEHVARLLDEGVREMQRRELPQKMVDAAVDIRQGDLKQAKKPQEEAAGTIRTVVDALYRASDALSGTKEGALKRAANRAREVKKKGLELAGLDEKDVAAGAPKPDETPKPGEEKPGEGKD
ncbi:MAG TPA: hypothetical protein VMX57_00850, partial [Planctomycetota bacterium]|nr:hypothetical protein [Planctomycetota bacterium]